MAFSMGGSSSMSEINVTPMIDILLIAADHLHAWSLPSPVTPKGLDALVPQPPKDPQKQQQPNDRTIVVQVIYRAGQAPLYKINEIDVNHSELQSKLTDIYANRAERVMFVKGDDDGGVPLHCRRYRHRQGSQRRSHRVDDSEDSGWPIAGQAQFPSGSGRRELPS